MGLERECAEWSDHRPIIAGPEWQLGPNISLLAITSPMITNHCYSASTSMSGGPPTSTPPACAIAAKSKRGRGEEAFEGGIYGITK